INNIIQFSEKLLENKTSKLQGERVCILTPNDNRFISCLHAAWLCGAIAVPLSPKHQSTELEYVVKNSRAKVVISTPEFFTVVEKMQKNIDFDHVKVDDLNENPMNSNDTSETFPFLPIEHDNKPSLILYTSGTTGSPKGVLFNHSNLKVQTQSLIKSWEISPSDVLLHVLPLHHIHGLVNGLLTPLSIGAKVVMDPSFHARKVWSHLLDENSTSKSRVNVFMAVPTIYTKLIQYFDKHNMCPEDTRRKCKDIRLMVSGSAALPLPVLEKWKEITGHMLLERYGMTEFGMGITNSYRGIRVPGSVGLPFPHVQAKIAASDEHGNPHYSRYYTYAMFQCYWDNVKATEETFVDGWFKTGDTGVFENGAFRIVGRTSVDIIKSGGYKLSALDIERDLLEHSDITEVSVIGVPDDVWGQKVTAIIALKETSRLNKTELLEWCRSRMASYKVPREFMFVKKIPRNAMGKVNKKNLLKNLVSN
uniref:Acyl-CoA synthetase family member 3, mitochondrial n=1 Tax=Ciona savignyi TaxID=51511 RepID=H2YMX5_CIOSA